MVCIRSEIFTAAGMFDVSDHHSSSGDPEEEDDDFGEEASDGVHGAAAGERVGTVMGESDR